MKYLIIYLEIEHLLNFLSQSEKGDFLDLMILYAKDQKEPSIENKNVLNVFNFIKNRLDAQFQKAKIKADIARANGINGGRPHNNKPKKTKDKPNKTQQEPIITQWVIPGFINSNLWNDFVEMRKKIKKPLSDSAIKIAIKKLTSFEGRLPGSANQALENSIESNWSGVFEPKAQFNNKQIFNKADARARAIFETKLS
jgi:hypothetical protein